MILKSPWILIFIPLIIFGVFFFRKKHSPCAFFFSANDLFASLKTSFKMRLRWILLALRISSIILFLVALSGPRLVLQETAYNTEGIDIILAIDTSGTMAAEDFMIKNKRVNRLSIVKEVVAEFIERRENDNIGLIAFAGLAYTVAPLTTDYDWIIENLGRVELGIIEDGTAVGSAIASSVARLKMSKAKSKVIILLTDGVNNSGEIDPISAASIAKNFKIKIYTIGAGTKGSVPYPAVDILGRKVYRKALVDLDEKSLKEIASMTGGKYFRATDTDSLRQIYEDIDDMEKVEIQQVGYKEYKELFYIPLILALLCLFLEIILANTIFMKIP